MVAGTVKKLRSSAEFRCCWFQGDYGGSALAMPVRISKNGEVVVSGWVPYSGKNSRN